MKCSVKIKGCCLLGTAVILLAAILIVVAGCASGKGAVHKADPGTEYPPESKRITGIEVLDGPGGPAVVIQGNSMDYTAARQPFPPTLMLSFPGTGLELADEADYQALEDDNVIRSVKTSQAKDDTGQQTARIEIILNSDIPHDITREDDALFVSFSGESASRQAKTPPFDQPQDLGSYSTEPMQTATQLNSVYATKMDDGMKVFVGADGAITNYKAFTIESPASIIFDVFNLQSPYKNEKIVKVDSPWVENIRYFGYPDRLRLVIETKQHYLSKFSAYPVDNGLLIHVGTDVTYVSGAPIRQIDRTAPEVAAPRSRPRPQVEDTADYLQSIYATQLQDSTMVTLRGDGQISDYEVFTTQNPPSIIFDIYNIKNPYEDQNAFPVDTRWVKQVRHETHPDKVRVSIETRPEYLSRFSAYPEKNGMVVYVGKGQPPALRDAPDVMVADSRTPRPAPVMEPPEPTHEPYPDQPLESTKDQVDRTADRPVPPLPAPDEANYQQADPPPSPKIQPGENPAWVNRIDFLSEEAGKSTLIIGTSDPVPHDIQNLGNRTLQLRLFNAKTPDYRQRPLITDRFESAVDRIEPRQAQRGGEAVSVVDIQLRESVPYYVEETDGLLMVHFEASSISPRPAETPAPALADAAQPQPAPSQPSPAFDAPPPQTRPSPAPSYQEDTMGSGARPSGRFDMPTAAASGPKTEAFDTADSGFMDDLAEPDLLASEPKYTGEPIALDFYETDIKNVFRILREVSGKNFAVDNDVTGKVTLTLEHPVPWDQVLDLVLKMNQLGKTMEGNIIRIATQTTLAKEEQQRQENLERRRSAQKQEEALEPLITEYIPISYSDAASEIQPHLEKIATKDRGTLSVDSRTNMIIMTDTAAAIKQARQIVEKLDRVTPQVAIEARIVEANANFSKAIGTEWGSTIGIQEDGENVGLGPQRAFNTLGGTYGFDMAINFPDAASYGALGFNFTRILGSPLLINAKLMAMESQENGRIVSAPRILTLDNKAANISQGFEYPYQTTDENGETTTEFKQVDLTLDVTPHITPDNRISMKINIQKNDIFLDTSPPALTTKSAQTELLVNDGDTIVIGGIVSTNETLTRRSIPGLANLPIIGWLFKARNTNTTKQELLIFITPRIVQLEQRQTEI